MREPWYHLTGGDASYADERKQQIIVALNRPDLHILKLNTTITTDKSSTYIAFNSSTLSDFSDNSVVPISLFNATKTDNFINDETPPIFEAFDLDLNQGTVTLSFNDVMDIQSLDPTQILFANAPGSNISYNLYGNYYNAVPNELWDHYHVTFTLTTDDLNAIKINTELATNPNKTYASVTEDVAVDIYEQNTNAISSDFLQVQMIREDMTSPQLLNFSLDIDSGILDLTFDEPVLPSSIVFQNITIHNKYNRSDQSLQVYTLDYEYIDSNETGTVVVKVELTRVSLSALQSMTALALSSENTLISIKEGAILDMNDNPSIEIAFENAISVVEVSPDVSPPILESFDLDLNDNFLILSFTEAVNYETLNLSALLIVNSFNDSEVTEYQRISVNSEIIVADFGSVLYIELTEDDENALKEFMRPIANSRNDTYL